uniref:Uncharacterized protein n=1 Tax=Physcomitrium patens TaxID=3218 RepID=A0A2K1KHH1_PHYPA|nr:hypothetical protein PHYPA_009591 [Physcomitrium patens]
MPNSSNLAKEPLLRSKRAKSHRWSRFIHFTKFYKILHINTKPNQNKNLECRGQFLTTYTNKIYPKSHTIKASASTSHRLDHQYLTAESLGTHGSRTPQQEPVSYTKF